MKNYAYDFGMDGLRILITNGAGRYVIGLEISLCLQALTPASSVRSYVLGEGTFKRHRNLLAENGHPSFMGAYGSKCIAPYARNWTHDMNAIHCTDRGVNVDHASCRFLNGEPSNIPRQS